MSEFRQPQLRPGESALAAFFREQDEGVYRSEMDRLRERRERRERNEWEWRQMPIVYDGVHPAIDRARRDFDAANGGGLMGMVRRWLRR